MAHYFENDDRLEREYKRLSYYYNGEELLFDTCTGVYSKDKLDEFSLMLVNGTVSLDVSGNVLDLGCGYGLIGIVLQKKFPNIKLWQSDINTVATELTASNCELNSIRSTVINCDAYENIPESFDWVFLNPPVHAGKEVMFRMFRETRQHLNDGGSFVLVMQKKHGAESSIRELRNVYSSVEELYRKQGVYIVRCRK